VKRKSFCAALACVLLTFSLLGCNALQTTNHLQSVQISTSPTVEAPMGTLEVKGVGGTQKLYAWGNYSSGKTLLLNNRDVAWHIAVTTNMPLSNALGVCCDPNAAPPQTVQLTQDGLLTAVPPFVCTFVDVAQPPATSPAWALNGTYSVTVTYGGLTSPAAFVAVASAGDPATTTNPTGACGP